MPKSCEFSRGEATDFLFNDSPVHPSVPSVHRGHRFVPSFKVMQSGASVAAAYLRREFRESRSSVLHEFPPREKGGILFLRLVDSVFYFQTIIPLSLTKLTG